MLERRTHGIGMDKYGFELWGVRWGKVVRFDDLSAHVDPANHDRVRVAFQAAGSVTGLYEMDFRITQGVELRWVSARVNRADKGL